LLGSNINRHRKQTIQKDEAQEHKYFLKKWSNENPKL